MTSGVNDLHAEQQVSEAATAMDCPLNKTKVRREAISSGFVQHIGLNLN